MIRKSDFFRLGQNFTNILNEQTCKYQDAIKQFKLKFLKQIKWMYNPAIFEHNTERLNQLINSIQYNFEEQDYIIGNKLVSEDQICKNIIFIIEGKVSVTI